MPGRSTSGFDRPGGHWLLAPSAKRNAGCWASRTKGELHPTVNRFVSPAFLHVDDSVESIDLFSGVDTSRDSNGFLCNCLGVGGGRVALKSKKQKK